MIAGERKDWVRNSLLDFSFVGPDFIDVEQFA